MTRDEYLSQLREEFIDQHLTPPGWMARLPGWLRGYVVLLYWVFFKPSALRLHINRLAPEAVNERGQVGLRNGLRAPAVRALLARSLVLTVALPLVATLIYGLFASFLGVPFDWGAALAGVAVVVAVGVALGVAGGVALGVAGGVGMGVAWGVGMGVAVVVAVGVAWGVAWGVGMGVALGVAGGVALGVAWGVGMGVALGVAGGVALGVALGVGMGVALGVALGVLMTPFWFAYYYFTGNPMIGLVLWLGGGIGMILGLIRAPIWLLKLLSANHSSHHGIPLAWDELPVLPQPGLARRLTAVVEDDPDGGTRWLAYVARHPYARWALTRAMRPLLTAQPAFLLPHLHHLLHRPLPYVGPRPNPDSDLRRREADPHFSTKLVLAELGGVRAIPGFFDGLARFLTAPLRQALPARCRDLCLAMYRLLEAAAPTDPRDFDPAALPRAAEGVAAAFEAFPDHPASLESRHTYHTLDGFLRMGTLRELARAPQALDWQAQIDSYLFPEVMTALRRLGDVGRAIIAYQSASSELARRDRLTEAQTALDEVRDLAARSPDVPQPYAALLEQTAGQWYDIVAAERDAVAAEREFAPLDDFYVAGPPLRPASGRLFVGRRDVFRRVEELWRNPYQKVSVVLHGQRRIGKTSILYHLQQSLGPGYLTVVADLQGILSSPAHPIQSDADLWYALARAVARRLREEGVDIHARPEEGFEDFLERSSSQIGDRTLALMLDEFEKLEQRMDEGAISQAFLEQLRHLIQHRQKILALLAGHHTLRQRMACYWGPLMGVARPLRVSYLDEAFARELITDPWDGFRLNYGEPEIRRLMEVTGCQPMLLQLACSSVVKQVNRRMKRDGYEDYPTARLEEVEQALDVLLEADETYYFDAVWDWLTEEQQAALVQLALVYGDKRSPWVGSQVWIERRAVPDLTEETLNALVDREVLARDGTRYRFRVELLRRWVIRSGLLVSPQKRRANQFVPDAVSLR